MRRSDREITEYREMLSILDKCDVIRLGINTPDHPYIVPMNFGYEDTAPLLTIYVHCAHEGLKLELIKNDARIGFEADTSHNIIAGSEACSYSMEYESIIGKGIVNICNDAASKIRGLQAIMRHYEPERAFGFTEHKAGAVCVLRIDVTQITGKRSKRSSGK